MEGLTTQLQIQSEVTISRIVSGIWTALYIIPFVPSSELEFFIRFYTIVISFTS